MEKMKTVVKQFKFKNRLLGSSSMIDNNLILILSLDSILLEKTSQILFYGILLIKSVNANFEK